MERVNREERKSRTLMYCEIIKRAKKLDILQDNRIATFMDIECADLKFNMRLEEWLESDDFNFTHDFLGIYNYIVRDEYPATNFGYFVPRFAGSEENENDEN